MLLRVEDVGKVYRVDNQEVGALRNINLNVDERAFLAIAGPSGSGKSTLLNLIGLIDNPTSGRILIDGTVVSDRTPDELAALRSRTIGFIFQTFNLLPVLSAEENVEYPLLQFSELTAAKRRERVRHYLDVVGLTAHARHRPNQLSGGQRQRSPSQGRWPRIPD
jgi:ABC-type antimicrobial peptide transport system, ATPase component